MESIDFVLKKEDVKRLQEICGRRNTPTFSAKCLFSARPLARFSWPCSLKAMTRYDKLYRCVMAVHYIC